MAANQSLERATRLDLPLLLPGIPNERDECVKRLIRLLEQRDGVLKVHITIDGDAAPPDRPQHVSDRSSGPQLCLHYDPERLTLTQVRELATLAGAGVTDRFGHSLVPFHSVGAEDDGRRIEEQLRSLKGVTAASVNFAAQVARVEYDRRVIDLEKIEQALSDLGVAPERTREPSTPRPQGAAVSPTHAHAAIDREQRAAAGWYPRNRELAWSLASGALLAIGWAVSRNTASETPAIALYIASYVFGARDNVGHFLRDLRRGHFHFNIDLLMVVAAAGAAILGEWLEGALLLFLFSLGHALEHYALGRARNAIKALAELAPQTAIVIREGAEQTVSIEEVKKGESVVVRPGERIPVDGSVREGQSDVNQAPITGESIPVEKKSGDPVFAGSVNGDGSLVVDVTAAVGDRTLDRVIRLVAEAETQKAPTQQFTDRFEKIFVPAVLVGDLLLIAVPPLLGFWTLSESFYRAMAMLVAASPCALALGTPAAVLAGIAQAARNGVLIKGGAHLETLGKITVLALDKTGTITRGEPQVTDIAPAAGSNEAELLSTAAAVERRSQHPVARAIMDAAEERQLKVPATGDITSVTGRGVRSVAGQNTIEAGRLLMFEEVAAVIPSEVIETVKRLELGGRTTIVVRRISTARKDNEAQWLGVLGVADQPRAHVHETLKKLKQQGIKRIVMLTGDNAGVGEAIARDVGIDEVRAGLLPEDKVEAIRQLASEGDVGMVGDGVNDAPALAHATVGIAMGGAGTAAALETADIALMGDELGRLPFVVGLSRSARSIIRQNLYVSLGVIVLLLILTVSGLARIGPVVIVHEGSTLLVIANALRLLTYNNA